MSWTKSQKIGVKSSMEFLTSIFFLAVGYFGGYLQGKAVGKQHAQPLTEAVLQTAQTVSQAFDKPVDNTVSAGVIKRPTAQQIVLRNEPNQVKEAKQAMRESLDAIPELQEAKELLAKQKANKVGGFRPLVDRNMEIYE